jgi:DNA invertase Pin-like site-specific DNA recombinase
VGRKAVRNLVAYYRVSTRRQGESGLGLEGQEAAVAAYARAAGCRVVAGYRDVESGRRADRPELLKAIAHAKRAGAALVIARLDRLARNVHFLSGLMAAGVDFVACDNPSASKLTVHILAAVAEAEAEAAGARTRAALQAYKARGGKLGASLPRCRNLTDAGRAEGSRRGGEATRAAAVAAVADLVPAMARLRAEGLTLQAIADRLNADGHTTRTGARWGAVQVKRALDRAAGVEPRSPDPREGRSPGAGHPAGAGQAPPEFGRTGETPRAFADHD